LYFSKEALEFVPGEQDIFITNSKGASQRLIFHDSLPLKEYESTHMENFRKYLKDNNLTIPHG